jgi:hypothetical protein
VGELFGIQPELIEKAQQALLHNRQLELEHGLFRPKKEKL